MIALTTIVMLYVLGASLYWHLDVYAQVTKNQVQPRWANAIRAVLWPLTWPCVLVLGRFLARQQSRQAR